MDLNIFDSIYYTITTMATVGYGDIIPINITEKLFSMTLALAGVGLLAFVFSVILTNFSEKISEVSRGAKMRKKIEEMKDPYILCGYGRVGTVVFDELRKRKQNVIIVENDEKQTEDIETNKSVIVINRDATEKNVLEEIMINKPKSIIIATGSDVTNLFIVLSVREINPDSWIVARSSKVENINRLRNAGANKIVSPETSGGNDLYFEAAKPNLLKITVQHPLNQIINEIEIVSDYGCTLENIDYHFPGISTPLRRKIGVISPDEIKNFEINILDDEIKRKSLNNLYSSVNNIHSHWISGPDKEALDKLIEKLKETEKIIGINLTNKEIAEITKENVQNICNINLE